MPAKLPNSISVENLLEELSDEEIATYVGGLSLGYDTDATGIILPDLGLGITVTVQDTTFHTDANGSVRFNARSR